jgi:predicted Zn-ribbon and HTH transcriptional regulator
MHLMQFKQLGALAYTGAWVVLHGHQRHVVQRDGVQLRLRPAGCHECGTAWLVRR